MTQNGNGTWVAAFGRYDGKPAAAGRARQPVTETNAEIAEVIALADAQIAIDDLTGEAR